MRTYIYAILLAALLLPCGGKAQWERIDSPGDAVLSCLVGGGQYLFAGSHSDGVFSSEDDGQRWTQAGLAGLRIRAIAISGNYVCAVGDWGVLYRTGDGGASWTKLSEGYEIGAHPSALCSDGTTLYALTTYTQGLDDPRSVFSLSTDHGESWTERDFPGTWGWALTASSTALYAATEAGVYRSEDHGLHWAEAGLRKSLVYALAARGSSVFAGADSGMYCCSDRQPVSCGAASIRIFLLRCREV
jgi:photosystem II stability/assembly factor-like uncharacterized protein